MNKKLLLVFSLILSSFFMLAGCGGSESSGNKGSDGGSSGEVIEMNVGNWNPSTHHYVYNVLEPWKKLVEEKTNGRIKVNLYHGATLGGADSTVEDVSGDVYDVGLVVATYYADSKFFPYTIGNLPFAFPDSKTAAKVLGKFGEKYAMDAYSDIHYLGGVTATDPYDLFSTKPVKSVEDIKGLKIRAQGETDAPLFKEWGAVPVSLTNASMYQALQKGTIDATFYTPIGSLGFKLWEVAPYVTKMGVTVTPLVPVMSKDFYNSLPDDLKKLFDEELGPKLVELYTESYTKELVTAYEKLKKNSKKVITLSPENLNEFKQAAKPVWEAWVERANAKGYPGEEMMEYFKKLRKEAGLEPVF